MKKNESEKKNVGAKRFFSSVLTKIIIILSLIATLILGGKSGLQKLDEIKTEKNSVLIFRELQKCSELVTAKNIYSDIISIKKTRAAGLAKSYSIIKYSGVIRGGIKDITESKITVSERGKSVRVELPPFEVLSNDISSIEVFDESRSAFVSISMQDIMSEIHFNQESAATEILETGFIEEGKSHAIKIISSILFAAGFKDVRISFTE